MVYLFPKGEGNIVVFDHMVYLFPHGECEQHDPVENQNWPKHRNVKHAEECHDKGNAEGFHQGVPSQRNKARHN